MSSDLKVRLSLALAANLYESRAPVTVNGFDNMIIKEITLDGVQVRGGETCVCTFRKVVVQ